MQNRHLHPHRRPPALRDSASGRTARAHFSLHRHRQGAFRAAVAADAACRHQRKPPARRERQRVDAAAWVDVRAWPNAPARQVRRDVSAACLRGAASSCRPHRGAGGQEARDAPRAFSEERLLPAAHRQARQAFPPRFHRSAAPWRKAERRCPQAWKPRFPVSSRKRKFPASPASCPLFLKQWTCCCYRLS